MVIYVNSNNEIKDVNSTSDATLTALEINDTDNPFNGWSVAKICCYKATVTDGKVTMMTPYVDSRMIDHIDQLGNQTESISTNITGNYDATKIYTLNEYVNYNGNLYRFIKERGSAIEPTNTLYWTLCDIATELNRIISLIK